MTSEVVASVGSGTGDLRMRSGRLLVDPHRCFACGELNEHGLHLVLHAQDEQCWSEITLTDSFQGWDGIAHGGIIAAILDEVMAWALIDHDAWGLTARMTVDFKRPVRIGVPIRAEGWLVDVRRRVMTTGGRILDGNDGEVLATAEATYVAAPESRKAELKARYRFRLIPDEAPSTDPPVRVDDRLANGPAR